MRALALALPLVAIGMLALSLAPVLAGLAAAAGHALP